HGVASLPASVTIPVGASTPSVSIEPPATNVSVGLPVTLTGAGAMPSGNVTLRWSVFSAAASQVIASATQVVAAGASSHFTYTPSLSGLDIVTLTATAAGKSQSTSIAVLVNEVATINLTAPTGAVAGSAASASASVTNNPAGVTYSFAW